MGHLPYGWEVFSASQTALCGPFKPENGLKGPHKAFSDQDHRRCAVIQGPFGNRPVQGWHSGVRLGMSWHPFIVMSRVIGRPSGVQTVPQDRTRRTTLGEKSGWIWAIATWSPATAAIPATRSPSWGRRAPARATAPHCAQPGEFSPVDAGPLRPATLLLPVTGPSLGRGLSAPLCDTKSVETADWTTTTYFSLLAHWHKGNRRFSADFQQWPKMCWKPRRCWAQPFLGRAARRQSAERLSERLSERLT